MGEWIGRKIKRFLCFIGLHNYKLAGIYNIDKNGKLPKAVYLYVCRDCGDFYKEYIELTKGGEK